MVTAQLRAFLLLVAAATALVVLTAIPAAAASPADAGSLLAQEEQDETDAEEPAEGDDELGPAVIFGTMRSPDGPVEGAQITILDETDEVVGTVSTDAEGRWELEVEGGDYTVHVEALPDDLALRDPDAATQSVSVDAGRRQAVPFPVGEATAVSGRVALFVQQVLSGLRIGLIIAMTAVGLSLIFGTTGLINFAHGELVVIGAMVAWALNATGPGFHLLIAGALGVIAAAAVGGSIDRAMFRPLRRRGVGLFQLLVVTIGLSLVLRFLLLLFFGGSPRQYADFVGQQRVTFGPFSATPRVLVVMGASILILVGVATFLQRSRLGKAMRAVADNRDLAESSGIDVDAVVSKVWVAGAGLAGLGGIFYGVTLTVDYLFGFQLLLLMFAGVILGGLGTAYGAMLGSIVVGLLTELSVVWFPNELKYAWGLGILVIVLLVRPQGLLGRRERIG